MISYLGHRIFTEIAACEHARAIGNGYHLILVTDEYVEVGVTAVMPAGRCRKPVGMQTDTPTFRRFFRFPPERLGYQLVDPRLET